jgi:hypothetical protein
MLAKLHLDPLPLMVAVAAPSISLPQFPITRRAPFRTLCCYPRGCCSRPRPGVTSRRGWGTSSPEIELVKTPAAACARYGGSSPREEEKANAARTRWTVAATPSRRSMGGRLAHGGSTGWLARRGSGGRRGMPWMRGGEVWAICENRGNPFPFTGG